MAYTINMDFVIAKRIGSYILSEHWNRTANEKLASPVDFVAGNGHPYVQHPTMLLIVARNTQNG